MYINLNVFCVFLRMSTYEYILYIDIYIYKYHHTHIYIYDIVQLCILLNTSHQQW